LLNIIVDLDLAGNVSLVLQIVILFLLVLGLPFVRGQVKRKNFVLHGYLTVLALVLHTILIFLIMVPTFTGDIGELGELSLFGSVAVWSHVVLGTVAEVLGIMLVASWVLKGPSKMGCARGNKWMTPVLVVWVISIVNGALIHILGII
jgi:hypothetical protein